MMTESNLEQIEEYLDGAMDEATAAQLRTRLENDPTLATLLAQSQSQRALRQAAWQAEGPEQVNAERLMWRVRGAMLDRHRITSKSVWSQWRVASMGSAAAACLLLGFSFGRFGHNGGAVAPGSSAALTVSDPSNSQSQFTAVAAAPRVSVPITNDLGQVVAWQTFDNADQAKNFMDDLHRTTHTDATVPMNPSQTKLANDEQLQPQQVPF